LQFLVEEAFFIAEEMASKFEPVMLSTITSFEKFDQLLNSKFNCTPYLLNILFKVADLHGTNNLLCFIPANAEILKLQVNL
jgi:hypothetical protein